MSLFRSHLCSLDSGDVEELAASMITELIYWQSLRNNDNDGTKCSLIYKVLQCIRAADPNAYEPSVLSIGPYHHGVPSLLPMEKEKWLCLDYVLKLNSNRSLHDYLAIITEVQREARICYSDDNIMNSRMFVEMLLLDSCFILVSLNGIGVKTQEGVPQESSQDQHVLTENATRKGKGTMVESTRTLSCRPEYIAVQIELENVDYHQETKQDKMETYYGQTQENIDQGEEWYNSSAVYDLLLLENQIPFFVVTKIYELLVNNERTAHRLLTDNLSKFVEGILLHFPLAIKDTNRPKDFDHLLHLCYMYFKPSHSARNKQQLTRSMGYFQIIVFRAYKFFRSNVDLQENAENRLSQPHSEAMCSIKEFQRWRRAEQYHEAGVEFKAREFDEHNPHSLLDIEFIDGVLHIPCLPVDDKSATLFRNLIAFEQSCPALGNDFASYIHFLCHLISVSDDVALLSRKGVIVHQLDSDEEVSNLFARLLEYIVFDFSGEHYLKSLCQTMEAHYQSRLNRWISWLRHNHFGNPWLGFAALASIVMVLCSVGQTIFAFLFYTNTPSIP